MNFVNSSAKMYLRSASLLAKHFEAINLQARHLQHQLGILGVATNKGQKKYGVQLGPRKLREAGLLSQVAVKADDVYEYGDVSTSVDKEDTPYCGILNPRAVGKTCEALAERVEYIMGVDRRHCLNLGGDHSLALGSIAGHKRVEPDAVVIWIDAHTDINLPQTSPSGNAHGMPLAFLVHELRDRLPRNVPGFDWAKPCLHAGEIAFIGIRDVDQGEQQIVDEFGITCFTMDDVRKEGVLSCLESALDAINPKRDKPIHVSFDVDSLDPIYAPATGTPVPGGLHLSDALELADSLAKTGLVSCVDVVEVNPSIGEKNDVEVTINSAIKFAQTIFKNEGDY